jgi:hypothetical protein
MNSLRTFLESAETSYPGLNWGISTSCLRRSVTNRVPPSDQLPDLNTSGSGINVTAPPYRCEITSSNA